jgi:hypothetical protein
MGPRRRASSWCAAFLAAMVLAPGVVSADSIEHIEHPTKVPAFESFLSLGNGIEPGGSGTYGFTLRNRYNATMENVTLTAEIYRWATVESAKPIDQIALPPVFAVDSRLDTSLSIVALAPNATRPVTLEVRTAPPTPEGVYFTRHAIEFDYPNFTLPGNATPRTQHFVMKSRGYFTAQEFESINYTDLPASLARLNVSGILPDSSFSVRKAAAIWPLVFVAGATAGTGLLAFAMYLTDSYPERYPRVKRSLLRLFGKAWIARALVREELAARLKRRKPKRGQAPGGGASHGRPPRKSP